MIKIKHKNFRKKFMFLDILFLNLFFDWYSYHYLLNTSTLLFKSARPIIILHFLLVLLHLECTIFQNHIFVTWSQHYCWIFLRYLVCLCYPRWSTWDDEKLENSSKTLISCCCSGLSSLLSGPPSSSSLVTPCGGNFRQD